MKPLWTVVLLAAAAVIPGCARVNSEPRLCDAADLVAQRLGHAPAWTIPWEDVSPSWIDGGVLPLNEAIGHALRNNRALRADLQLIGQADADLVQAGLLQNPVFNLMMMFPDGGGLAMLASNGAPLMQLQDLWLIPVREDLARARLQETVLRVADRGVEIATEVRRVYARLQYAQRALELMQDNITLAEQSVEIIQTRQSAGRATQVELNVARIRADRLRSDLIAMEADYRSLQREMLLGIGFPAASDRWTVEPVHELRFAVGEPPEEETLLRTGAVQRLDLLASGWTLQSAARQVALEKREALPDVALGFAFQRDARGRAARGPTVPARVGNAAAQALTDRAFGVPAMPSAPMVQPWQPSMREPSWVLGPMFDIEVPIFDQNQAQIARAVHEYQQRLAEYEDRAQTVVHAVREALVRCRQARAQVEYYRATIVPDVQRNLELAQQSFVAGQESLTIYLSTQEDLIMTRLRVLEFVRDFLVSRADLERAVGGQLPELPTNPAGAVAGPMSESQPTNTPPAPGPEVTHEH